MEVVLEIPDDIAQGLLANNGADLPRALLEKVALEGYRSGELTHAQVTRLLGFPNRVETDGFLKRAGITLEYTEVDLEREAAIHEAYGALAGIPYSVDDFLREKREEAAREAARDSTR